MSNSPLSWVALIVKIMAKGNMIPTAIHDPNIADTELSSAKFLPKVFVKKYKTYIMR